MTVNKDNSKKQIFFVHSGGAQSPGQGSYNLVTSMRKALGNEYEINYPIIKNPEAPTYKMWKFMLQEEIEKISGKIIFVGHSLGGSMLLKYLSEVKSNIKIIAMFFIATPWWGKDGWDINDFVLHKNFAFKLPKIQSTFLYHSVNDSIVPFEHLSFYRQNLQNTIVREINGSDHVFSKGLPQLIRDIKNL